MNPNEMDWKEYERTIHEHLKLEYPDASVSHNVRVHGELSQTNRQIDVLISEKLGGTEVLTAVDTKFYNRRIDVKDVEEFLGLLRDVKVDRGIMVSKLGYSDAAFMRALKDEVDLDLDIFSLDEFTRWQAACGIPHSGSNGVVLPAPFGWAIDGQRVPEGLARLYRRGISFYEAAIAKEFMYVNLWDRQDSVDSLDALLDKQGKDIKARFPDAVISVALATFRSDYRTCIRRVEIAQYPTAEITGFVEFPTFIFFAVMFTPFVVERRNIRKLEYTLKKVLPIAIKHAA